MYTVSPMPKRENLKGPFRHFQFKMYGEEMIRWSEIYWTAKERATDRRFEIGGSELNRALLNMSDAIDWLVTKDERLYFQSRLKERPASIKPLTREQYAELGVDNGSGRFAKVPQHHEKANEHEDERDDNKPAAGVRNRRAAGASRRGRGR